MNGLAFNSHQAWAFRRAEARVLRESPFRLPDGSLATMTHVEALPPDEHSASRLLLLFDQLIGGWLTWASARVAKGRVALAVALPERYHEGTPVERHAKQRTQLERAIRARVSAAGLEAQVALHAYGHAAAAYSIQWAGQLVVDGHADVAFAIGLDSYYDPDVIDALVEQRRLFDGQRIDGLVPGEGCAMVVIGSTNFVRDQGLPVLARLEAASVGQEPLHRYVGLSLGDGLTDTVLALSEHLERSGRAVDWWIGDVSGESYRVRELQLSLPRFTAGTASPSSRLEQLPEHFGDLGAATIPTGMAIVTEGFMRGDPAANTCLLWASSDGPTRGAVLLRHPSAERGHE